MVSSASTSPSKSPAPTAVVIKRENNNCKIYGIHFKNIDALLTKKIHKVVGEIFIIGGEYLITYFYEVLTVDWVTWR